MDKLKKAFGHSDPLGRGQMDINTQAYLDALKMHQKNMTANAPNNPQTDAFLKGVIANTKDQERLKVRSHIANEVEKMAEEIGAPTLLHAVVLAIRTMEIPE